MFKSVIEVEKEWGNPRVCFFGFFFFRFKQGVTIENKRNNMMGKIPP